MTRLLLCQWALQDTYYIKPPYQDWESSHIYLIHRNKYKKIAKIGRQGNITLMKEQEKSPETELNEMETSSIPDIESRKMFIRMLKTLSDNYKGFSENYKNMKKDIQNIKKNQSDMKTIISEMKDILKGIHSRLGKAEG